MSQVVLHISDVHFSEEKTHDSDARSLALARLIQTVLDQPTDWQPSIVCLTGDIAKRGKPADYQVADAWLKTLLSKLSLSKDALFICAGNHDVDRDFAKQLARPPSAKEADDILQFPPITQPYATVFDAYSKWAAQFGLKPYKLGEYANYLVGYRVYGGLSFVAFNTAWNCKDDDDKDRLWLGLPQVQHLEAKGQFPLAVGDRSSLPITIVLLHHPKNWLHPDESRAAGMRPNVWDYVAYRTDIVLSGHTHEEVRRGDSIAETALHFNCGATYAEKYYFNNFRLLRIDDRSVSYRTFEFSSRTPDLRWQSGVASVVSFPKRSLDNRQFDTKTRGTEINVALLRERAGAHALRILQQKSRAVKPEGDLPHLTPLTVAVKVRQEKHSDAGAPSSRDVPQLLLPFEDALRKSRRTLLLGELGTGKSTLAAEVVDTIQNRTNSALAFLIPAKQLTLPSRLTAGNLMDAFSKFISESVAPALGSIDLRDLLKIKIETTIILDGLDEIENNRIVTLLNEFAVIPEHWETVSVVATGRPIEMSGATYADWQAVTTTALDDEQKRTIFENEALAQGRSLAESREHANKLATRLRNTPALSRVISTPLALRLFYYRLSKDSIGDSLTLGDLVLEVIHERLTGWAKKDDKHNTTEFFEKYFPEAESRVALLAKIALQAGAMKHVQASDARQMLATELKDLGVVSVPCANEALGFFFKTGLLATDDSIQFPVSLFQQALTGIGWEALWSSQAEMEVSVSQWREVSFAAAVARRKGTLPKLMQQFKRFIRNLSAHDSCFPMAAYVVTESKSVELAIHFIQQVEVHKGAAIRFFDGEWDESARVIAEALKIAGSGGFDWFYDKYLNPKYPFIQGGSFLTGAVFREWVKLSIGNITAGEKQKIEQMVIPMLKANTMQVHDIVASAVFLIPDAFDDSERLAFVTQGLTTKGLSEFAENEVKKYMQSEKRQLCERFLLSAGSAPAALLWLNYNAGMPRTEILITTVRSLTDWQGQHAEQLVTICKERLGKERWIAFVRLALFHADTKVSVGAALALYDEGEKETVLFRTPLVGALHDGGYVRRAEVVLDSLLSQPGMEQQSVEWLAKVIHDHSHESDLTGGHSGEFRLFLKRLHNAKDGPSLLAWAIIGLGQFVLPRYPEIRQLFRDLFTGSRGAEYREAFRQRLRSWNGVERRAVAAVLVTSLPDEESQGLQTIVKSSAGGYGMRWHEWDDYLLSINFGLEPLTALKSKLSGFPKEPARFGYRLLLNNNIDLNEDEQKQALEGILERPYRIREAEILFLKSDKAKFSLLELTRASDGELRRESAEQLMRFHESTLGVDDLALCSALTIGGFRWNRNALADQLEKLRTDTHYSKAVEDLGIRHKKEHSTPLLLDLLRRSLNDSTVWDDLVWELMCKERVPWNLEDPGMWLLEAGLRDSETGIAIGKAAEKCLSESQKRPFRSDDIHQWLTVIADEFVGVPKQELEKRVIASPIHHEATAALLFRLGTIPTSFKRMQPSYGIPPEPLPFSEAQLRDASRQTEGLPENLCERLLSTVIHRAVRPEEIESSKQLGSNGALIASVLAFTQGFPPSPEYVVLTLPLRSTYKNQRQGCLVHLLNICNVSQYERLKADPRTRSPLLFAVQKAFTDVGNVAEAASVLLELREYLTGKEAQKLFDSIVEWAYRTDDILQEQIVRWFSRVPIDFPGELPETLAAINNALARVSEKAPEKPPLTMDEAMVDMSLALGAWRLSDRENIKATEAYWRGLRILFRMKGNDALSPLADAFQILEPLLVSVNPDLLRSAIWSRNLDPDPVVRASFVIFRAFGGMKS